MKEIVCTACGYVGPPATRQRGSPWVALVLWVCALLPGLIYSIWRLTTRYQTCPACNRGNIFSADSPMAKKFLGERDTKVREQPPDLRAPEEAGRATSAAAVTEGTAANAGPSAATAGPQDGGLSARHRPAEVDSTQDRAILYGRLSKPLSVVAFVTSILLAASALLLVPNDVMPMWVFSVLLLFGGLCGIGALILRKKARRHAQPRFVQLESPPGVLFLRPFQEDKDFHVYSSFGSDRTLLADWRQPRAILAVLKFGARSEWRKMRTQPEIGEILSELTRSFGHLAAIGEPGSPPILGADNVYVSDDGWQEKVLEMARGARLVILTAGTTPGVLWETENMVRNVAPARLLLNIPGMTPGRRRAHYVAFREAAAHLFPRGLPGELKARVIAFADDWSPVDDQRSLPPAGTAAHVAWWMSRVLQ